jgi:hypothetical protein
MASTMHNKISLPFSLEPGKLADWDKASGIFPDAKSDVKALAFPKQGRRIKL